ncbi:MAG: hypothetical protein J6E38_07405 [Clostridia bacterium]|nr:hypothetical protein [Clostridia bacterium]
MKKFTSALLAVFLFFICINIGTTGVEAAKKVEDKRTIAIVFDNSGSMYMTSENNGQPLKAWCRATYAMEVFASMLNEGDTLMIYPMWEIEVDGEKYTMDNPMKITGAKQASDIREIYTPNAQGTPIESIDSAINGLSEVNSGNKYLVVLTDGDSFKRGSTDYKGNAAKPLLDEIIQNNAGPDMTIMYLGIGEKAVIPDTPESDYFEKKHVVNSEDVLSALTEMCNRIFGRDTLPKKYISGDSFEFDISMSKLILFAQGKNISDLKVVGENGKPLKALSKTTTKYSTKGAGKWLNGKVVVESDTSLQGEILTFGGCESGKYKIQYSGEKPTFEVYYEPDVDLDFVFTDSEGNDVNPDALYEGDYSISFGMWDNKEQVIISSELLGTPKYRGTYSVKGEETPIACDGYSGYENVYLKMGDTFDANLTVTYLSGYTITKRSTDFGWPFGGIKVLPMPAGNMKLKISGGDDYYSLQDLPKGSPFIAEIFYEGSKLTGAELEKVVLDWDKDVTYAKITPEFADDHYNLLLSYKDTSNPQDTQCGKCTVTIYASYQKEGSDNAQVQQTLSYIIRDDFVPVHMDLYAPDSYITIKDIEESRPIVASFSFKGKKLSEQDFDAIKLSVDCGGIEHKVTPDKKNSAYLIKLLPTKGIAEGNYPIRVKAEYTDHIGRVTETEGALTVTLSLVALWLKWLFWILIILLIALIIWLWLRTPVLPKKIRLVNVSVKLGIKTVDTLKATVRYPSKGKRRDIKIKGTGDLSDASWSATLIPAKDSYRYLPSKKRKALVVNGSVKPNPNTVAKLDIGNESFFRSKKDGSLIRASESVKDFNFPQGTMNYSGTKDINGRATKFTVSYDIKFE